MSGNDSLLIGYPPRGRSGRIQELGVEDVLDRRQALVS